MGGRGVVVVAHPDDESLWFAGLMIAWPLQWTVIACSIPESDPIRAWKFYDACEILGATGKVLPLQESGVYMPLRKSVMEFLPDLSDFDVIVTHGTAGEYGHRHHIELGDKIAAKYPSKTARGCYSLAEGELVVQLDGEQFARKQKAIDAYDHMAPADGGLTKGEALIRRYSAKFDLRRETYDGPE